jgi:hypothetical protein
MAQLVLAQLRCAKVVDGLGTQFQPHLYL